MKSKLTDKQVEELLVVLKARFEENMERHKDVSWSSVKEKLTSQPNKLETLYKMEESGGEPDVVALEFVSDASNASANDFIFVDCSEQSPNGRRSLCYDEDALESRKANKPKGSALNLAMEFGAEILNEKQYRKLQEFGDFDTKTSSWILTSEEVRKLGGAEFADFRYDKVYVYHNGAESYYASRGFRCFLRV